MPTSTSSVQALENVGAFRRWGIVTNTRVAALVFGFAHGFGMSSKLRALSLSPNGLIGNMIAYNIGVELGQIFALTSSCWRCRYGAARPLRSEVRTRPTC